MDILKDSDCIAGTTIGGAVATGVNETPFTDNNQFGFNEGF
jgi:hypothetical protein